MTGKAELLEEYISDAIQEIYKKSYKEFLDEYDDGLSWSDLDKKAFSQRPQSFIDAAWDATVLPEKNQIEIDFVREVDTAGRTIIKAKTFYPKH